MKKLHLIVFMALFGSPPLFAAAAPPAPTTENTSVGDMLDNPAMRAIVDKYLPGFSTNEQTAMAQGMTLHALHQLVPAQITKETLEKIDADLAKLPTK